MDGKGREDTYNFFSRRLGGSRGAGHRAQGAASPCKSAGAVHACAELQRRRAESQLGGTETVIKKKRLQTSSEARFAVTE